MGNEVGKLTTLHVRVSDIAKFLKTEFYGRDIKIKEVKSLDDISENALVFSKGNIQSDLLKTVNQACFITPELPDDIGSNAFIVVENPRLAFARILSKFFVEKKSPSIGLNSVIHPTAKIADSVIIGNSCTIGRDVEIGEHTEIRHNVILADRVKIGRYCLIRSSSVIGEEGFGFENQENKTPIRIPHLGTVEIGDHVEIGNFTAIAGGTLKNTIIHANVKIDNLVHIAHNCIIEENSMVIACAEISGSSVVGKNCWLGAGCSTIQKITLGDNCLIGIGTVVLKDVPPGAVMAGNPAKIIKMQGEHEK